MALSQFIANGEAFVVVPLRDFEALQRTAEEAADEADAASLYADYTADIEFGRQLSMPAEAWARIRAGERALRVVREYRGLTQKQLAEASGLDQPQISAIEQGRRTGTAQALLALAKALRCDVETLVVG